MRNLIRAVADLIDEADFWLPLAGLVLVSVGMAVTMLHLTGYLR